MSVLVFIDAADGHVKKSSFEALTYGAQLAKQIGTGAEALLLGTVADDVAALGKYGVTKIHHVANEVLNHVDAQVFASYKAMYTNGTQYDKKSIMHYPIEARHTTNGYAQSWNFDFLGKAS